MPLVNLLATPTMMFLEKVMPSLKLKQLFSFLGSGVSAKRLKYVVLSMALVTFFSIYLNLEQWLSFLSIEKCILFPYYLSFKSNSLLSDDACSYFSFIICSYFLSYSTLLPIFLTTFSRYTSLFCQTLPVYRKIVLCLSFLPIVEITFMEIFPFQSISIIFSFSSLLSYWVFSNRYSYISSMVSKKFSSSCCLLDYLFSTNSYTAASNWEVRTALRFPKSVRQKSPQKLLISRLKWASTVYFGFYGCGRDCGGCGFFYYADGFGNF